MRSKLFVPGSRPELFAKALASDADALSFDLEDAVPQARKHEARDAVAGFLASRAGGDGKLMVVRVNAWETPHFGADLDAVAQPALDLLNLPKAESPRAIQAAARQLDRLERERGIVRPIGILVNIETPEALACAAELAGAHPRVAGLQVGLGDLFEDLGVDRRDAAAVHHVLLSIRLAAGRAGVWACDGAYADLADREGFLAEARMARRLGYVGKSCIHPSQVAAANDTFRPTDDEIRHAARVLQAEREAARAGRGAFTVDGRMVDAPFIRRAGAVMETARRLGLADDDDPTASGSGPRG